MTTLELIERIEDKLPKLSEKKLEEILKYIDEQQIADDIDLHLNRILKEDNNLLRRLAQ